MNRKAIRDLSKIGIKTADYRYATAGTNCDVKAVMRSKSHRAHLEKDSPLSRQTPTRKAGNMLLLKRGDVVEVIVEAFVKQFGDHFINCCPKQQSYFVLCTNRPPTRTGDYQESWQPATILDKDLYEAKTWLKKLPKP
jgi:phosphoribosylglycinamide formyltransferase 2